MSPPRAGFFIGAPILDRQIIYSGQVPQTLDLLNTNKQAMVALAKLCADVMGTTTVATGLACVPTSPASMSVNVNPGQIYQLANIDGAAYSAIAADTTHSVVKQGILLDAQSFALTAPSTAGYSQNYLIQATYLDNDINNTVLPYYNSANPAQAFNGPAGNGTAQPTTRAGQVSLQLVAGTAATTGTQTTPAVTTGYVGLWVITVANGQTTITATNITQYAGAPILPSSLLASIQNGNLSYAVATGTANAHTIALTPALTARVDGMMIRYKAPAANTGAVTLADGVGTANVLGANHAALQGGEYVANGDAFVVWNSSIGGGSYILVECTGGAVQVAPATQSQQAVQFGQVSGVVGSARNLKMSVTTATASATLTADEIIVESALGGLRYCLANFNKTVNLATTGAGGMDTGTAPVSGYVALYAIYNPATQTSALLATNATSAAAPNVYGGTNMPSGYTASALVSVWPTNGSGQFVVGAQRNRRVSIGSPMVLNTNTGQSSYTSLSLSGAVPPNAISVIGIANVTTNTVGSFIYINIGSDSNGTGTQQIGSSVSVSGNGIPGNFAVDLISQQTIYWKTSISSGTPNIQVNISAYEI